MKQTNKKIISLIITLVLALGIVGVLTFVIPKPQTQKGAKEVHIIVYDRTQTEPTKLLDKQYRTDAEYVYQLLQEHQDELKVTISEGAYGKQLDAIMGLTNASDWSKCWCYLKDKNYADGIGVCTLEDGTELIFYYTSDFYTEWWK